MWTMHPDIQVRRTSESAHGVWESWTILVQLLVEAGRIHRSLWRATPMTENFVVSLMSSPHLRS